MKNTNQVKSFPALFRCVFIVIFPLFFLYSTATQADENYKYTSIVCMKEIGTLWISALNLEDTPPPDWEVILEKKGNKQAYQEVLQKKYNIFSSDVKSVCKLNKTVYKIIINYDPPSEIQDGACEPGHLTILRDNKKIVDNVPFNTTYPNNPGVMQVVIYSINENTYVKILSYSSDAIDRQTNAMETPIEPLLKKPLTEGDLSSILY